MTKLQITVQDQILTATPDKLLVSRSVGEVTFEAAFDASWEGYAKTIVFWAPWGQKSVLYTGGEAAVPREVLDRPTDSLRVSAVGIKEGHRRPTAAMHRGLSVIANGAIEGGPPGEYSPALWEQVMERLEGGTGGGSSAGAQEAQAKAEEAQRKAEAAAESAANDRTAAEEARTGAETAQGATEASAQAAQVAQTAAELAATDAAASRQGATQKAGEAAQSATVAQDAQMGAEAAKDAAEAVRAAIPVPVPGSEDEGKVPVARGTAYQLEAITVGIGNDSVEVLADDTLQEAAAYIFQGAGAADTYRQIVVEIACPTQPAEVKTGNSTIFGTSIATYFIAVGGTDNMKTAIDLAILNSDTAVFRRSSVKTASADPMYPNTYKLVSNQMVMSAGIDATKPLLKIPAELPAGTRIRITGVRK